jgi:hypothetical protein
LYEYEYEYEYLRPHRKIFAYAHLRLWLAVVLSLWRRWRLTEENIYHGIASRRLNSTSVYIFVYVYAVVFLLFNTIRYNMVWYEIARPSPYMCMMKRKEKKKQERLKNKFVYAHVKLTNTEYAN